MIQSVHPRHHARAQKNPKSCRKAGFTNLVCTLYKVRCLTETAQASRNGPAHLVKGDRAVKCMDDQCHQHCTLLWQLVHCSNSAVLLCPEEGAPNLQHEGQQQSLLDSVIGKNLGALDLQAAM